MQSRKIIGTGSLDLRVYAGKPAVVQDGKIDDPGEKRRTTGSLSRFGSGWAASQGHLLFSVLTTIGVLLRVITLVAYRPALLYHADALSYLHVARELVPSEARPSLYSLFLRLVSPLQALLAVPLLQHLMGLAVAVVLYQLLRHLGVGNIVSAIAVGPLLLDAYQINIEQYILSETLFQVLVVGALAVLVRSSKQPSSGLAMAGAGLLLGAAAVTRSAGLVLIVPALAYVLWKRGGLLQVGALVFAFVLPLIGYASWFSATKGPFTLTTRSGSFLYGRVAPFADCSRVSLPEYERVLCDPRPPSQRPDGEFYVWDRNSPIKMLSPPAGMSSESVLKDFSRRIIAAQPFAYLRTITGDLVHYFSPVRYERRSDFDLEPWKFSVPYEDPRELGDRVVKNLDSRPPHGPFASTTLNLSRPLIDFLSAYQSVVYTPGLLLGLALLAGLIGIAITLFGKPSRSFGAECLLFVSAGFLLLLVPAAATGFDYRYLLPSLPLLPVAGALGVCMISDWARSRRRNPKAETGS